MAEYIAKNFSLLVWRYTIQKLHKTLFLIFHVFSFLFSAGVISRNLIKETHCHNLLMKPFLYFFILFSRDGKSIKLSARSRTIGFRGIDWNAGGKASIRAAPFTFESPTADSYTSSLSRRNLPTWKDLEEVSQPDARIHDNKLQYKHNFSCP